MGCATSMVKYIIFLLNLIFALAGLAFLAIGVIFKLSLDSYTDPELKQKSLSLAPTLIIIVGAVVFIIAFFGCCGAIRESTCMLTTYAIILLTLFILQIALGVYAFIQIKEDKDSARDELRSDLWKMMKSYNTSTEAKEAYDAMQVGLKCCGVDRPEDWQVVWPNGNVPKSCCIDQQGSCTAYANVNKQGCAPVLWDFTKSSAKLIGIIVIVIAAIEFGGAVVALCLASSIRNHERRGNYA